MKQIKTAVKAIRYLLALALLGGMIGIPAWIVHEGYDLTWRIIWIPLGIQLAILLAMDVREAKREEQEQKLADLRRAEQLKRRIEKSGG